MNERAKGSVHPSLFLKADARRRVCTCDAVNTRGQAKTRNEEQEQDKEQRKPPVVLERG